MSSPTFDFIRPSRPQLESFWRGIILFGNNTATYKFALSRALLEIAQKGKTAVTLEELAEPYSRYLATHLNSGKRQITSASSQFLDGINRYNQGEISQDAMIDITVRLGFNNVIDAFHNLHGIDVPRFFLDERKTSSCIKLTDELLQLVSSAQASNLPQETEARWKLVETAWNIGISSNLIVVKYDNANQELFVVEQSFQRIGVTSARDALNGYQKGKCFYCFREIRIGDHEVHVDHVFPHMLKQNLFREGIAANLDGVWNLVLACRDCNMSKMAQRPDRKYVDRLHTRNEFFIGSHHPLRETLIGQTGKTSRDRHKFLMHMYDWVGNIGKMQEWRPIEELEAAF